MRCSATCGGCSHRAGPPAPSSSPRPSRRSPRTRAEVIRTVLLPHRYCDILVPVYHEQRSEPSGSRPVDVGVDVEPMPEQQDNVHDDEGRRERARSTAQQPDGGSQNGSGRCGGVSPSRKNRLRRMNSPPTHRAPSPEAARPSPAPGANRRNHAFPPRPALSDGAAIRTVMHAVRAARRRGVRDPRAGAGTCFEPVSTSNGA